MDRRKRNDSRGRWTQSELIGFGGASSALARVTVTQGGCASTGAALLNLRNPLTATVTVADGNVGTPARVVMDLQHERADPCAAPSVAGSTSATPPRTDVRAYVFTPTTEEAKTMTLTAALYRIWAQAVGSGTGPQTSSCSYCGGAGRLPRFERAARSPPSSFRAEDSAIGSRKMRSLRSSSSTASPAGARDRRAVLQQQLKTSLDPWKL
jgi:hypothetical protein